MKKKLSRMECAKEVRRILNRNGVDLCYCQYSVGGSEVRLTGWVCRTDGSEFHTTHIDAIIIDFQNTLPGHNLTGDCDNWSFTTDHITRVGEKKEKTEDNMGFNSEDDDYDFEAS